MLFFEKKIPLISQLTLSGSGSSCLTMILKFWGKDVSHEEINEELDPGRDGITFQSILNCALRYGLKGEEKFIDDIQDSNFKFPILVKTIDGKFLIIEKITKNQKCYYIDPKNGRGIAPLKKFSKRLNGSFISFLLDTENKNVNENRGRPNLIGKYIKLSLIHI